MKLEELQSEAKQDLQIIDQERLDQESYKNQNIKPKWLEYRTKYDQLLIMSKANHQRMYREKWEYYGGKADAKVYAAKPFDLKILKTDLQIGRTREGSLLRQPSLVLQRPVRRIVHMTCSAHRVVALMGSRDKEGGLVLESRSVRGEQEKLLGGVFLRYEFQ